MFFHPSAFLTITMQQQALTTCFCLVWDSQPPEAQGKETPILYHTVSGILRQQTKTI
jgi:hypothetical protein